MIRDLTVVVGLDARTREQFLVSSPTWLRFYPELASLPWLVFFDASQVDADAVFDACGRVGVREVTPLAWGVGARVGAGAGMYATQREKMLTGFVVRAPLHVRTDWWAKIDTDALACRRDEALLRGAWFAPTGEAGPRAHHSIIASPWSYTKPADQMAALDRWADVAAVPGLPLRLPYDPQGSRCVHPRIASWLSFYRTAFTVQAALFCERSLPPGKMPVPSQDGYHWYMATRLGYSVLRVKMKRHGWTNFSNFDKLREAAREILNG